MEICRLWGLVCSSPACRDLFPIFLSICDKELPSNDSCKYLLRGFFSQKWQNGGRRNASMKRKPVEENTDCGQLTPGTPGCKEKCSVVHSHFPDSSWPHAQPVVQQVDCWSSSGTDSTEVLQVRCSFPYSLALTSLFWVLQHLREWAGQWYSSGFGKLGLN